MDQPDNRAAAQTASSATLIRVLRYRGDPTWVAQQSLPDECIGQRHTNPRYVWPDKPAVHPWGTIEELTPAGPTPIDAVCLTPRTLAMRLLALPDDLLDAPITTEDAEWGPQLISEVHRCNLTDTIDGVHFSITATAVGSDYSLSNKRFAQILRALWRIK